MKIILCIFAILFGGFIFFGGVSTLTSSNVTCGGQTMSQGDNCVQYANGVQTGTLDYTSQQNSNQGGAVFMLIFGPLVALLGVVLLFFQIMRMKSDAQAERLARQAYAERLAQRARTRPTSPQPPTPEKDARP